MKNSDLPVETLDEAEADQLNHLLRYHYRKGTVSGCDGMTKETIRTYQFALRIFYRFHADLALDPDDIPIYPETRTNSVDSEDMLSKPEIERLKSNIKHPRDAAIF
jgi:site-specific recombinase XerD